MNWPLAPLSSIGSVNTGSTPKTNVAEYWDGDIPFVTPSELGSGEPITWADRRLTTQGAAVSRIVPTEAVLVCCIGSLGKTGISGTPVVANQQINWIDFDKTKVWPRYGYYACERLGRTLESSSASTTIPIVNKSRFSELTIALPSLGEQRRIAAILDKADALRRKRRRAIELLDSLTQSIFLEMFGDPGTNPKGFPRGVVGDLLEETQYGTSAKAGPDGALPILRMGNVTNDGRVVVDDLKFIDLSEKEVEKYTVRKETSCSTGQIAPIS